MATATATEIETPELSAAFPTETSPLLSRATPDSPSPPPSDSVWGTLSVLLVGVFVSQADTSLVLASYGPIASSFGRLDLGVWLLTAYVLAQTCVQPLYGKLSDIFGRATCLQAAYVLFAVGTAATGLAQSMPQMIVGRAIQGAGGAGMVCLVSILITDLVPMHRVASLRSHVNLVQTAGRSVGGAVGGWLVETIGWRWSFLLQCPLTIVAIVLVEWRLKGRQHANQDGRDGHDGRDCEHGEDHQDSQTLRSKLNQIDFLGAALLSLSILAFCLVIDLADGTKASEASPRLLWGIGLCGIVASIGFVVTGRKKGPSQSIFPLSLLTHPVVLANYAMLALQNVSQMALMMAIPLYFQVMNRASTAAAGAFLVPSVVGNTVGALATGYWIQHTGRFKLPTVLAPLSSLLAFSLCLVLWTGENTASWKSLLVFPAGMATGAAHSAVFVGLASGVASSEMAVAGSGLYLAGNIGTVVGASASNSVYQSALVRGLQNALKGRDDMQEIMDNALSNIEYVQTVGRELRDLMLPAYTSSFHAVFAMSMACGGVALVLACMSKEKRLLHSAS